MLNLFKKRIEEEAREKDFYFFKIASLYYLFIVDGHGSRATAFVDDHFGQVPFDDVHVWTEINERHARKFSRSATRLQVIGEHLLLLLLLFR